MHVLSNPAEASTPLGNFIVETLTRSVIALTAFLALAAVATFV